MKQGKSTVCRADFRATTQRTIFHKLDDLLHKTGLPAKFKRGNLVAIKLNFGERGNTAYIRPGFVRHIVEMVRQSGAHPFLTDTNTLYVGDRTNSAAHTERAILNGFDFAVSDAPIIIADGLRGESAVRIEVDGRHLREVSIAVRLPRRTASLSSPTSSAMNSPATVSVKLTPPDLTRFIHELP